MFKITDDNTNKYSFKTREQWLELAGDWVDETQAPSFESFGGALLWNDAKTGVGTKGRWGDLLVKSMQSDHLVYVQPRVGWAGISLAALAKKYDKKLTLFMPAAKEASAYQLACIERGATPIFRRIAAMPVLNKYAKEWAEDNNAQFVPFGLDHPLVVAAGVKSTLQHWTKEEPKHVVSVVSTGVLTRTLQIAWPNAKFHGVAVARNLHAGEIGSANVQSYDLPFARPAKHHEKINEVVNSAPTYDCKGLERFLLHQIDAPRDLQTIIWNVAGDVKPENLTSDKIDSFRNWGETR